MEQLLVLTALGAALLAPAPAPKPVPKAPAGFPPFHAEAIYKDAAIEFRSLLTEYRTETRVRERTTPDGRVVKEQYTVSVPVFRETIQKLDPKKAIVYRAGGKDVDAKELAKLLEKPTMVFISSDYKRLDPFFLQWIASDALIVVPPSPGILLPIPAPAPEDKRP